MSSEEYTDEYQEYGEWVEVPECYSSKAEYRELMGELLRAEEREATESENKAIKNVKVTFGTTTSCQWLGQFGTSWKYEPGELIMVDDLFNAKVDKVEGTDVYITFAESEALDDRILQRGRIWRCKVTIEDETEEVNMRIKEAEDSEFSQLLVTFALDPQQVTQLAEGKEVIFRTEKARRGIRGVVHHIDINNNVRVRVESVPGELRRQEKWDICLSDPEVFAQQFHALKAFEVDPPLLSVPVVLARRHKGPSAHELIGTFTGMNDEPLIANLQDPRHMCLFPMGETKYGCEAMVEKVDENGVRVVCLARGEREPEWWTDGTKRLDIYPSMACRRNKESENALYVDESLAGPHVGLSEEIKTIWLGHPMEEKHEASRPIEIPSTIGDPTSGYWKVRPLNLSQKEAVEAALNSPFTIIQGPAGTGKTTCVAAYVWNVVRNDPDSKVLVTTPSKASLDQSCIYLSRANLDVVRLQSMAEKLAVPSDNIEVTQCILDNKIRNMIENKMYLALAILEEKQIPVRGTRPQEIVTREREMNLRQLATVIKSSTRIPQGLADYYRCLRDDIMSKAQVVCCTLGKASSQSLKDFTFDYVVIDEATCATEPAALGALMHNTKHVLLVGDPLQLWPYVTDAGYSAGLNQSIVYRLALRAKSVEMFLLKTQYRMHQALSTFPSQFFYSGRMMNAGDFNTTNSVGLFNWPDPSKPIVFYHVDSREEKRGGRCNPKEAKVVANLLYEIFARGVSVIRVGVLTTFRRQIPCIRAELRERSAGDQMFREWCNRVGIFTVDAFQGSERDLIIISTVQTSRIFPESHLAEPRRLNVMLTRARHGMIIVGNARPLRFVYGWNDLLKYYKKMGLLYELTPTGTRVEYPYAIPSQVDWSYHEEEVKEVQDCYLDA